ncbi:hypothetical protein D3C73_1611700 [compost metagenome]
MLDRTSTAMDVMMAPVKAPKATPNWEKSAPLPKPTRMANVAPREAPDEMPRI